MEAIESRLCSADSDPLSFGAVLSNPRAFVLDWEREFLKDPENTVKPGICRHCRGSLGDSDEDRVIRMGKLGMLPNVCCRACELKWYENWENEQKKAREKRFMHLVPMEYIHWDISRGNADALARALGKFSISARRSVVLHGSTGTCKTRIAWELLKKVLDQPENFTWLWLDAFEVAQEGFPKGSIDAHYLVIDDLGNEPKGYRSEMRWETKLLFVLRKRFDHHRPVIITTQLTPQQFKERFFNGVAAEAIMRRFRERTDSIATN